MILNTFIRDMNIDVIDVPQWSLSILHRIVTLEVTNQCYDETRDFSATALTTPILSQKRLYMNTPCPEITFETNTVSMITFLGHNS